MEHGLPSSLKPEDTEYARQIQKLCHKRLILQQVHWKVMNNPVRLEIVKAEIERRKKEPDEESGT